jgi:ribonuclease BN (tRNA processing enzyme)
VRVTILGSGTLVPDGLRGPSGYALEAEGLTLLLDGGTGTLRRLAEAGIDFRAIDHLLYTHVHPDHTAELVPILFANRHTPGFARTRPVTIFGPRGFDSFYRQVMGVYGRWVESDDWQVEVRELWGERTTIGALAVETFVMRHSVACVGYRLTTAAGLSVAYTGDTDATDAIVELARDVDVLIAECSTPDELKVEGHLSPGPLGELAAAAGARLLVLTHLYPQCEDADLVGQCRRHFAGSMVVAHDLMQIELDGGEPRVTTRTPVVRPLGQRG